MRSSAHLIGVKADNFKRLKTVNLKFDGKGGIIEIKGKNAQGKSSLLDAIASCLAGSKWQDAKPIKEGADRTVVEITLDSGLTIRKIITKNSSTLTVKDEEGRLYPNPQKLLDGMISNVSFKPMEFARLSDTADGRRKQVEVLLDVLGLREAASKLDADIKLAYEERKSANNECLRIGRELGLIPPSPEGIPSEEIPASDMTAKLLAAQESERDRSRADQEVENVQYARDQVVLRIRALEEDVERLKADLPDRDAALAVAKERRDGIVATSAEELQRQIDEINQTNRAIRESALRRGKEAELRIARRVLDGKEVRLEELRSSKQSMLDGAQFPITGLGWNEDGVTYREIPMSQISSSEKIRVSVALGMALNPSIRFINIDDGSLLDADAMQEINRIAIERDYLVLVERVGNDGGVGIVIEDGEVVEDNRQPLTIFPEEETAPNE